MLLSYAKQPRLWRPVSSSLLPPEPTKVLGVPHVTEPARWSTEILAAGTRSAASSPTRAPVRPTVYENTEARVDSVCEFVQFIDPEKWHLPACPLRLSRCHRLNRTLTVRPMSAITPTS